MKRKRVRLFIQPYCGWCHRAERWLNERGIVYDVIDITSNEDAYAEMIQLSGQELSPVIEVDGQVLSDFAPQQLAEFWNRLEEQHVSAAPH